MSDRQTTPEIVLTDPDEVVALLRSGDRLVQCQPAGWVLARSGVRVADDAAFALTGPRLGASPWPGGSVQPLGDTLPGILRGGPHGQTWSWVEDRSHGLH